MRVPRPAQMTIVAKKPARMESRALTRFARVFIN
jgi:hypothetical protein